MITRCKAYKRTFTTPYAKFGHHVHDTRWRPWRVRSIALRFSAVSFETRSYLLSRGTKYAVCALWCIRNSVMRKSDAGDSPTAPPSYNRNRDDAGRSATGLWLGIDLAPRLNRFHYLAAENRGVPINGCISVTIISALRAGSNTPADRTQSLRKPPSPWVGVITVYTG